MQAEHIERRDRSLRGRVARMTYPVRESAQDFIEGFPCNVVGHRWVEVRQTHLSARDRQRGRLEVQVRPLLSYGRIYELMRDEISSTARPGDPLPGCLRWGSGPDRCVLQYDHRGPCQDAVGETTLTRALAALAQIGGR